MADDNTDLHLTLSPVDVRQSRALKRIGLAAKIRGVASFACKQLIWLKELHGCQHVCLAFDVLVQPRDIPQVASRA